MFTFQEILARVRGVPFLPFEIVTSAGEVHPVTHPDLIFIGQRYVNVGIGTSEHPTVFDRETRIAIWHITELRDLPQSVAAGNNGTAS